ncbi:C4-dicarboxylate TRAP transporter substrate-binding protein [Microbacterium pseudoresistens]|uniref:TRAP-type C4-dicarboxylate transport system substrate-binding protein n=1 Tax=Microbacterium pseudoresistens TaxID=640634 RepID=A0A7Y9ETD4_9MICO|nr:TRAP transporter substrate-binding protein DctP [Microbacterium pseudoresistens]NYD53612.1 TRAP-type C4-dicarboxylate transport system substrate-binding protein [Microbacterium pseudoresistens]
MNKRRLAPAAGLITLALVSTGCSGGVVSGSADKQTLTVALYTPKSSSLSQTVAWWTDAVTEATDGAVAFNLNYDGSLLAADDTLQGVGEGRADMGLVAGIYYESQLPLTSISGVPYLVEDPRAAMLAFAELSESSDTFAHEYASNNVMPLFFLPARDALLGSSDAMIESVEDLRGRSIRAAGTFSTTLAAVGANPVSIVFNELYEALDRGVVDSYSGILLDSVDTAGLYEVADYVSNPRQGLLTTYPVALNADLWEGLSDEVKTVMTDKAALAVERYFTFEEEAYAVACDSIESSGGEVYMWSDDAVDAWAEKLGDTVLDSWRDRVGDAAEEFEDSYRAALADAEGEAPENGVQLCADRF